jgi:hypothetical protein
MDSNLSWKQHIEDILPRLNKACFAIGSIKPLMFLEAETHLFFLFSLNPILWNYIVGILYIVNIFLKLNKEPLELLQILKWKVLVVNCLKTSNLASLFSVYFFFTYAYS